MANKLFLNPAIISLFISNLTAIILIIINKWSAQEIFLVYLIQSFIIIIFFFLKIISLKKFSSGILIYGKTPKPTNKLKFQMAFSFLILHFVAHYFLFIILIYPNLYNILKSDNLISIIFMTIIFFINHAFSFYFYKTKKNKINDLGFLLIIPNFKIIPIIFFAFFGGLFISNVILLLIILIFKTLGDIIFHLIEHSI
jgi:hypothetical protein